jgi:hypothetical protein
MFPERKQNTWTVQRRCFVGRTHIELLNTSKLYIGPLLEVMSQNILAVIAYFTHHKTFGEKCYRNGNKITGCT